MRFSPDICPSCGKHAIRTIDSVPALALMDRDADGDYEYSNESKMCWDGQTTETDDEGRWLLDCGEHSWYAELIEA